MEHGIAIHFSFLSLTLCSRVKRNSVQMQESNGGIKKKSISLYSSFVCREFDYFTMRL